MSSLDGFDTPLKVTVLLVNHVYLRVYFGAIVTRRVKEKDWMASRLISF